MAYGCTYCGGKLAVENTANGQRILTYQCGCGRTYFGPFLPANGQQAAHWLGCRSQIKLGRLVKLGRVAGVIVATDNKRHILATY